MCRRLGVLLPLPLRQSSGASFGHHGTGWSEMAEFIVAIGLVLVIEGLLFAAFPRAAKRLAASALESPETSLRIAGIISAVLGIVVIWLMRG